VYNCKASATDHLHPVPNINYTETHFIISIGVWDNRLWLLCNEISVLCIIRLLVTRHLMNSCY